MLWLDVRQMGSEPRKSQAPSSGVPRQPGRPRSEQARRAILRSTLRLLQHSGYTELTMEAIAADASVGKATLYRWWPNKGALIVDAFAASAEDELHFPDTGTVLGDVRAQMGQWVDVLRSRRGRLVAALVAAGQSDAELLEAFRERFLWPRRQEAYRTLRRGIERGELPRKVDLDALLDTLYGAIYMRFLIRHDELDEQYLDDVCAMVLTGAANNHGSSPPGARVTAVPTDAAPPTEFVRLASRCDPAH